MSGRYAAARQVLDDVRDIDDAARRSEDRGTMQRLSTTFRRSRLRPSARSSVAPLA